MSRLKTFLFLHGVCSTDQSTIMSIFLEWGIIRVGGNCGEGLPSCALDCTEHDSVLFPSCSVARLCARTSVFESKPLALDLLYCTLYYKHSPGKIWFVISMSTDTFDIRRITQILLSGLHPRNLAISVLIYSLQAGTFCFKQRNPWNEGCILKLLVAH